jgi:hypothetical protein
MMSFSVRTSLFAVFFAFAASATASDLSYTFMDFQYMTGKSVEAEGLQSPVPGQTVSIRAEDGDGIAVGGSLNIGQRFFIGGTFQTAIVDVFGIVENPFGITAVQDEFDLIQSRVNVGYLQPIGENFDLIFDLSYDSTDYDFGSFAGENFDFEDAGTGAQLGFRWNPTPRFELYSFARYSSVGKVNLSVPEFEPDTLARVGMLWYFFEDLGLGVDYETGIVDTVTVSMRFSFGDLRVGQ